MADASMELAAIKAAGASRVGPATSTDDKGVVQADPVNLAEQAGATLDAYALARMIASEKGGGTPEEQLGLAECAVNYAKHVGKSVSSMLLGSSGHFGEQGTGKWASTSQYPNARNLAAARAAINGSNFTDGAYDFFDPRTQDKLFGQAQGKSGATVRKTSQQYIDENAAKGLVWVGQLPNVDASRLMMFKAKGTDTPEVVKQVVETAKSVANRGSIVAFLFLLGGVMMVYIVAGKGTIHGLG